MAVTQSNSRLDGVLDAGRTIFHQKRDQMRQALARRKVYRATLFELSELTDRDLRDLGISPAASRDSLRRQLMTVNSHTAQPDGRHAATASISLSKIEHGFLSILAQFGDKAKSALKAIQMARMLSTLANMSDYELALIGIQRSDIRKYAETLMAKE